MGTHGSNAGSMMINGHTGESIVSMILNQTGFKVYRNLYVKDGSGDICQIDFLLLTKNNIIVFEVKNYNNCIIKGDSTGSHWTACYSNKKHTFYNPIKQNIKHIGILSNCLSKYSIKYYNYVVFTDGCIVDYSGQTRSSVKVLSTSGLLHNIMDDCEEGKPLNSSVQIEVKNILDYYNNKTYELSIEHEKYFNSFGRKMVTKG